MSAARLQEEIDTLLRERERYRAQVGQLRNENLQAVERADQAETTASDLRRELSRVQDENEVLRTELDVYKRKLFEIPNAISSGPDTPKNANDGLKRSTKADSTGAIHSTPRSTEQKLSPLAAKLVPFVKVPPLAKKRLRSSENLKGAKKIKFVNHDSDSECSIELIEHRTASSPGASTSTKLLTPTQADPNSSHLLASTSHNANRNEMIRTPKTYISKHAKIYDGALVLPKNAIASYLSGAQQYTFTSSRPSCPYVPRIFLRIVYGGSDQHLLQFVSKERSPTEVGLTTRNNSIVRRFIFPMHIMNPFMPMEPGQPGLLFATRHEVLEKPAWGVWNRHPNGVDAVWRYLGEYESQLVGNVTANDFKTQKTAAKSKWASLIRDGKAHDVYVAMRARIALRKTGRLPCTDRHLAARLEQNEINAIKLSKKPIPIAYEDIISAFERGDEQIDIIRMKCVGYDHILAKDVENKFKDYPRLRQKQKDKLQEESIQVRSSKTPSSTRRNKDAIPSLSSLSNPGSHLSHMHDNDDGYETGTEEMTESELTEYVDESTSSTD